MSGGGSVKFGTGTGSTKFNNGGLKGGFVVGGELRRLTRDELGITLAESIDAEDTRYVRVWVRYATATTVCVRLGSTLAWARNGVDGVTASYAQLVTVEDVDGLLTVTSVDNATAQPEPPKVDDGIPFDGDGWHASEDPDYKPNQVENWIAPAVPVWTMQRNGLEQGKAAERLTEIEYGYVWRSGAWRVRSGWIWYGRQLHRYPPAVWVLIKTLTPDPVPIRFQLAAGTQPPPPGETAFVQPGVFDAVLEYREQPYRFMLPSSWWSALRGPTYGGLYVGPSVSATRTSRLAVGVDGGMSMNAPRPNDLTENGTPAWSAAGEIRDY